MAQNVQEILYRLNTDRMRKMRAEIRERFKATDDEQEQRRGAREAERFGLKAEIAGRLHLLDLKRAGHSPTRTEYTISHERSYAPRMYATYGSVFGSPSLLCAENA